MEPSAAAETRTGLLVALQQFVKKQPRKAKVDNKDFLFRLQKAVRNNVISADDPTFCGILNRLLVKQDNIRRRENKVKTRKTLTKVLSAPNVETKRKDCAGSPTPSSSTLLSPLPPIPRPSASDTNPKLIRRIDDASLLNLLRGHTTVLNGPASRLQAACTNCLLDCDYDVNFRAALEQSAFQVLLLYLPTLVPWTYQAAVPHGVIVLVRELPCIFIGTTKRKIHGKVYCRSHR
jgi:hypothetical protein